jgi:uncharacterized protein (TIGR02246 family)
MTRPSHRSNTLLHRWLPCALVGAVSAFAIADDKAEPAAPPKATKEKPAAPPVGESGVAKSANAVSRDEQAVRASARAFVDAFNKNDAKGVAGLWTESGSLAEDDGEILKGREAIEKAYAGFFKQHPGAKLVVQVRSVHFPSPQLAEEDGVAQVIFPGDDVPVASRYTAVHVKDDGGWRMASVRETKIELPSNYSRLKPLDWLVGEWTTSRDDTTVRMSFRWIANRSFLQQTHTVTRGGITTASGIHIIGWDPEHAGIRSWSFDSTGGFGTGLWNPTEDGIAIESSGMLASGAKTASQDSLIRVPDEDDVLGWKSINRRVGSETLPDLDEVVLDRVESKR